MLRKSLAALMGVLTGTTTGCGRSSSDATVPRPFPLPTKLGISIQEVKDAEIANGLQGQALDEEDRSVKGGPQWRSRLLHLSSERSLPAVIVIHRYRVEDGLVWLIFVRHAAGGYAGGVGRVDFNAKIADVEASLGSPALRHAIAPVLDQYVWHRDDSQIVVEAYSRDYDDVTGFFPEGEISSVLAHSTTLGPPGYVAYYAPAKR